MLQHWTRTCGTTLLRVDERSHHLLGASVPCAVLSRHGQGCALPCNTDLLGRPRNPPSCAPSSSHPLFPPCACESRRMISPCCRLRCRCPIAAPGRRNRVAPLAREGQLDVARLRGALSDHNDCQPAREQQHCERGGRQASDAEHALAHWAAGRQMNGGRDGLVDCGRIHKSLATRSVRKTLFKPGTSNAGWRHLMWYTQGEPTASEASGASGPPRSCTARWHL